MTQMAVPIRLAVDGLDLGTLAYAPYEIKAIEDAPPLRGEDVPRSGRSGRKWLQKKRDSRMFTVGLNVLMDDASGVQHGTPAHQARLNLDALMAVLLADGQRTLVRTMDDGALRTSLAEVVNVNNVADPAGDGSFFLVIIEFRLADPWWYGAAVIGGSVTVNTNPKALTVTPGGTIRTSRLVLTLTGPLTNPRIDNLTTGAWVALTQVLASAKVASIDCDTGVVTYDGLAIPGLVSHFGSDTLLDLKPIANSLLVTSSVLGGTAQATAYPAYN